MKGFSLVELVVASAIFVSIIAGIYGIFTVAGRSYSVDSIMVDLGQQTRQSMFWMVKDAREGRDLEVLNDNNEIRFNMISGSNVRYFLNENNQIIRQENGVKRAVGNHIETLSFEYAQNIEEEQVEDNVLHIAIEASRIFLGQDLRFSLKERVRLRNE